ncbi:RNA-directed DNA polymerase [Acidobacteria bacterium AH-259-L09]|nr:RNA-directed DNA polymerase [Acidobacteria bacterium AH-259-L09]
MKFSTLISRNNLQLAWRRITTGQNLHYKRYFRDLYRSYELALNANLRDLHLRLKGGSFQANEPTRIYLPKPSGLQRPLTLLSLEDQILLQATAQIFAKKLGERRRPLELKYVFSNVPNKERDSIFFFTSWRDTYRRFSQVVERNFIKGFVWIANFDLAAFYDTISHELLLKTLFPLNGGYEIRTNVQGWLKIWSAEKTSSSFGHGIPQGPIASDFLAECFLLPIDGKLAADGVKFVRYVDDIRLFGKTETEVRKAAIQLEVLCRDRGVIPQSAKFVIKRTKSVEEAVGSLPSLTPPEREQEEETLELPEREAVFLLRKALDGRPQHITDKSRVRYVLYRAEPSQKLLTYVLRLLPRHPEEIDVFAFYLNHYRSSRKIVETCLETLRKTPYEYVRGELWHVLARMMRGSAFQHLIDEAIADATKYGVNFSTKWGALHFLCRAELEGLGRYAEFVKHQDNPLLQGLLAEVLPDRCFKEPDGVVSRILKRSAFEASTSLAEQLARQNKNSQDYGILPSELPSQTQHVFQAIGIIQSTGGPADPIGEILANRYAVDFWQGWRSVFQSEYAHAQKLLCQADPVFDSGRSVWLSYQNSFNHALFLAIQERLREKNLPGLVRTLNWRGEAISFGSLLDPNKQFSRNYPTLGDAFRECNDRRNKIPGSHPYEMRGGGRTSYLKKPEQKKLWRKLSAAYQEIIDIFH